MFRLKEGEEKEIICLDWKKEKKRIFYVRLKEEEKEILCLDWKKEKKRISIENGF